ncbi:uncharacterized protein LOC122266131 [Penaeus japonicus]|uniref:uncharacterized protein LOC122266131 n=1 Tax=Penaeus japonicus TaxID=27405 RepID=UPI001C70D346|nr:uncharacterized protein LOC122266131 [Penaeus japonicus]XP_042891658.1 uncharacterized protein LOC122266131 [Penaeus japonicus]
MASAPSESDALLGGRRTPPPRYSSINPFDSPGEQEGTRKHSGATANVESRSPTNSTSNNLTGHPTGHHGGHMQQPHVQPGTAGWWSWIPGPAQYFPPGLEHLSHVSELTIFKHGRKVRVCRDEGQQIYVVRTFHPRCCSGGGDADAVTIKVLNNAHLDVLNLTRTDEESSCCGYTPTHLEVCFPPGNMVGVVQGSPIEYTVHNPSGDLLFLLQKEPDGFCSKGGYEVVSADRFPLGRIHLSRTSCCSNSKEVKVSFPTNLDLRSKALILAGALSIRDLHWD